MGIFTQYGGTVTSASQMQLGSVSNTAGEAAYKLHAGTITITNSSPFAFSANTAPIYFDFAPFANSLGGTLNLRGTWDFASLTGIANSDFRLHDLPIENGDLPLHARHHRLDRLHGRYRGCPDHTRLGGRARAIPGTWAGIGRAGVRPHFGDDVEIRNGNQCPNCRRRYRQMDQARRECHRRRHRTGRWNHHGNRKRVSTWGTAGVVRARTCSMRAARLNVNSYIMVGQSTGNSLFTQNGGNVRTGALYMGYNE